MVSDGELTAPLNDDMSQPLADPDEGLSLPSSAEVSGMAWAFTQYEPLSTGEFISQARRRGFYLDTGRLRQLYRRGLLVPFVYASGRQVSPTPEPAGPEPGGGGTSLQQLRYARDRGRLTDLGLLYSKHQLLVLPLAGPLLARVTHRRNGEHFLARLPEPDHGLVIGSSRLRSIAIAVTALEARYLPALDPEWLQLTHGDREQWERFRAGFDPAAMSDRLGYPAGQAGKDAEFLLRRARSLDPLPDSWSGSSAVHHAGPGTTSPAPRCWPWITGRQPRSCCYSARTWPATARQRRCPRWTGRRSGRA